MSEYSLTVGMEVHVELKTKSKMFCGCKNDPHASTPNTNVCPVCLAHPGTLPVPNKEAIKFIVMVGKAIGGTIADYSEFDRKNYFYPDIPKAYQISQYAYPFVKGGVLAGVEITRVHLEEDTARSLHDQTDGSIVDFNRAGVPLMELVTEPVIHDAETAGKFARELQLLLRTLSVSDANMEKGEMRVEANISISNTEMLGVKVEVKNLNSVRAMESAIQYEIRRQEQILSKGGCIQQETRGWDENKSCTFPQRSKETAEDYRYFPDPDLPKFLLTEIEEFKDSRIAENMSKLPAELRLQYRDLGIPDSAIEVIVQNKEATHFFNEVLALLGNQQEVVLLASNYLISDIFGLLERNQSYLLESASAENFASLMGMVQEKKITSRVAKDLLPEVVFKGSDPKVIAVERGLLSQNDHGALQAIIADVLSANTSVVDEYRKGKEASLQFLVGQVMKATRGASDPGSVIQALKDSIPR